MNGSEHFTDSVTARVGDGSAQHNAQRRTTTAKRRWRRARPRSTRAGRIEKKKRAKKQAKEAAARAQQSRQRNTSVAAAGCSELELEDGRDEMPQTQQGDFNSSSSSPASAPQPTSPEPHRQCRPQPAASTAAEPALSYVPQTPQYPPHWQQPHLPYMAPMQYYLPVALYMAGGLLRHNQPAEVPGHVL